MKRCLVICVWVACVFGLLSSCGGGSAGTGSQTYTGTVVNRNLEVLPNAEVLLVANGALSVTNQAGEFSISTDPIAGDVQFQVTAGEKSSLVLVQGVPEATDTVRIRFEFDEENGTCESRDVRFERDDRGQDEDDDDSDEEESENSGSSSSSSSGNSNSNGSSSSGGQGSSGSSSSGSGSSSSSSSSSSSGGHGNSSSSGGSSSGSSSSGGSGSHSSSSSGDDEPEEEDD